MALVDFDFPIDAPAHWVPKKAKRESMMPVMQLEFPTSQVRIALPHRRYYVSSDTASPVSQVKEAHMTNHDAHGFAAFRFGVWTSGVGVLAYLLASIMHSQSALIIAALITAVGTTAIALSVMWGRDSDAKR